MSKFIVVLVTVPSKKEAEKISKILLGTKLAACINVVSGVTSFFNWKGKLQKSSELILVIKTRSILFNKLEKLIMKEHSYTVPEIIALPILKGSRPYLEWLSKN